MNPRYSFLYGCILLCFTCIASCSPKPKDSKTLVFKSNDATKLFFRNVRSLYYDKQSLEQAKLDVYRMKGRYQGEDYPHLNLALVNNWLQDEAYIILEPNSFFSVGDTLVIRWADDNELPFVFGGKDAQIEVALQIYRNIKDGERMKISKGETQWDLLEMREDKEIFRKTMVDFLRLVQMDDWIN